MSVPRPVQIVELQVHQFERPHSGRVKHFQHGAVAQPSGSARSGCIITCSTSRGARAWAGAAETRQFDLGRRIVQDVILPRHPFEPHAQRHEPRVLRAEAQRLAVLLAVVEQIPLIAFEHRPRDLRWLGDAALSRPTR